MATVYSLWKKYSELIRYGIFGVLTTLVNYAVYFVLTRGASLGLIPSNIIAWACAVAFAYITNRIWVFHSEEKSLAGLFREISLFVSARLISGALDTLLLWLFVDIFGVNDLIMKLVNGVIVILLNYAFSKFYIFGRRKTK